MERPKSLVQKPPKQWRLKAPVSKADRDAIRVFQRVVGRRIHLIKELQDADRHINEQFIELQRRGQVEEGGPPGPTTAPVESEEFPPEGTEPL